MNLWLSSIAIIVFVILVWAWCYPERVGKWVADFCRGFTRQMMVPIQPPETKGKAK